MTAAEDSAQPAVVVAPTRCLNCGTVILGRYCHACGQRHDPRVHTVGHFLREATEDLTHADSRVWHTLFALLCKPGFLTQEFFAGRRARYLPPVRLYLVISVLFFLVASSVTNNGDALRIDSPAHTLTPANAAAARPGAAARDSVVSPSRADQDKCDTILYRGPMPQKVLPRLRAGCRKIVQDGGTGLKQAFLHNIPRVMFIFLPLIAFFMMLMYWRPRHFYVEHLLFLIHSHALVFLVGIIGMLVGLLPDSIPTGLFSLATALYLAWYFFRSVRVYYAQRRFRTFAKVLVLGFLYILLASIMLLLTAVYSAATL